MNSNNKFKDDGYVIYKNLISEKLIDDFFKIFYSDFINSSESYPQMNNQEWGKVDISKNGFLKDPLADIHLFKFINSSHNDLTNSALNILCSNSVKSALKEIDLVEKHSIMMSMFFDQNKGTPAHQDWYYLDSLPNGNLIGAWIALEDINEKAGRFYVVPKSQNFFLELSYEEQNTPDLYEEIVFEFIKKNKLKVYAPKLKKGDVLFWNSGTIHGSMKTIDSKFSRKSFTAHFLPAGFDFVQNRYSNKIRKFKTFSHNDVDCRITRSVLNVKSPNPRSTSKFGSQSL